MKLLLYADEKVAAIYSGIIQPRKTESGVKWGTGELSGVSIPFILIRDEIKIEVGDTVTMEFINNESIPFEEETVEQLKRENEDLRQQLAATNADLMGLMEYVFGGGQ